MPALRVPGAADLSRKQLDGYSDYVGRYGARGLAWIKVNDSAAGLEGLQSPIAKFLDEKAWQGIAGATGVRNRRYSVVWRPVTGSPSVISWDNSWSGSGKTVTWQNRAGAHCG